MVVEKRVEYLVVDTTAFIQNAPLQDIASNIVTVQEVINEITNKRQLRRLVVLPYDLVVKDVFPENIKIVTEFAKKTGDYRSLSATDIRVMALTYQLEKEFVGVAHINTEPQSRRTVNFDKQPKNSAVIPDVAGFYLPGKESKHLDDQEQENRSSTEACDAFKGEELSGKFARVDLDDGAVDCELVDNVLAKVAEQSSDDGEEDEEDDDDGWITPSNIKAVKRQIDCDGVEEKDAKVACMTTDFAMQNVLKQMNLQICALDGRVIAQVRTFVLRCYACFGLTSRMEKRFCPKCGNDTLKKVAVTVDADGRQHVHVNARRPLTCRGKKFSLPTFKGGKHANNPIVAEDQPRPDQRVTRLARTKNNPLDDDYVAGYSPFVARDVNSRSAQLCIRPAHELKHWMRTNPNEARRRRK